MQPLAVLFAVVLAVQAVPTSLRHDEFSNFKLAHGKTYPTLAEENLRLHVFSENLRKMEEHNKRHEQGLETYTMGVNQFADMTNEEFVQMLTLQGPVPIVNSTDFVTTADFGYQAPESADWRQQGAVTPVKNQGQCGSCWSFSTTGAVEGALKINSGELVSLSEQNLVDCDTSDSGCQGGMMQNAFTYIEENGINYESDYPYVGSQSYCQSNNGPVRISGYRNVEHDEDSLQAAVGNVGPISIAVDASQFQMYNGGIFYSQSCSSDQLNHGVLAVGYGNDGQYSYWLVKNSWGESWGENGYIRIIKDYNNQCGVASNPSYPVV